MKDFSEFKNKLHQLLLRVKFNKLLRKRCSSDSLAGKYLKSRGLDPSSFECYEYKGDFEYQGKIHNLPECVVVPLRSKGVLIGVWIRFIQEKRFFIWLTQSSQKMWFDIQKPGEPVFVAESIFDALSLRELFGVSNVAASLGVSLSSDLIREIPGDAILCFDNDRAGMQGMLRCLENEETSQCGILKVMYQGVELTDVKDYNSILTMLSDRDTLKREDLEFKILRGIQAKVYLKSQL